MQSNPDVASPPGKPPPVVTICAGQLSRPASQRPDSAVRVQPSSSRRGPSKSGLPRVRAKVRRPASAAPTFTELHVDRLATKREGLTTSQDSLDTLASSSDVHPAPCLDVVFCTGRGYTRVEHEVSFTKPLGVTLGSDPLDEDLHVTVKALPFGGSALEMGVVPGMAISRVGGVDISGLEYGEACNVFNGLVREHNRKCLHKKEYRRALSRV
eukprot:TRINITY_DN97800_c0_g1_i1.p1 TRINITY_DN97800_c0_g1~~TRINITY_DN97800_c0_g1_i1.p1  ORF type:complete len:219 (+),score=29.73 TRINITY_DN97800_c0_g1_i1:24-659(+)